MLHVRTELRSGQYTAAREDADAGEGWQEIHPPVCYQRAGRLRLMRVEAVLKARSNLLGPTVRRGGDPRLQNAFKAALKVSRSVSRPRKKRAMFSVSVA